MYAETDCMLALIKDEDRPGGAAERLYRDYEDELWSSSRSRCQNPGEVEDFYQP